MAKENKPTATHSHIPLRLPEELKTQIKSTAQEVSLSEQETIRQALRRGLPILKKLLGAQQAA